MRRLFISAIVLTLGHLFACLVVFCVLFAVGMARFDDNNAGEPATWEYAATCLLVILSFPAVLLAWCPLRLPALVQNSLFLVNSSLWGYCLAWMLLRRKDKHRSTA